MPATPPQAPSAPQAGARVAAVVVDYEAADVLAGCVGSLLDEHVGQVVVVENGTPDAARAALADAGLAVPLLVTGRNVGYGAGANRGLAAVGGDADLVLVCNPDLRLHPGAVAALVAALDAQPSWAVVGPRILTPDGDVYPSVRAFPSMVDAAGHAVLALFNPHNRFSRRYRTPDVGAGGAGAGGRAEADWVSGACFLARRAALDQLGGFDEAYFMFAEDMDLCWRAHAAGWGVGVEPAAVVTHAEGVSRRRRPYRMLAAHHRSALRFANRTTTGWRRLLLPAAAAVLGLRFVVACADQALRR
ncbi:MAG TPA: glycosyltransferase family 2 protein [Acidimicrobiales bacterium]|nr:glycosyltransferase family 2 protein [Acidimicrobiales bacterium]